MTHSVLYVLPCRVCFAAQVFHLPCKDAAKALGVAHSKLKRRLRKMHISRWPHRKLASLDCLRDAFVVDKRLTLDQREVCAGS